MHTILQDAIKPSEFDNRRTQASKVAWAVNATAGKTANDGRPHTQTFTASCANSQPLSAAAYPITNSPQLLLASALALAAWASPGNTGSVLCMQDSHRQALWSTAATLRQRVAISMLMAPAPATHVLHVGVAQIESFYKCIVRVHLAEGKLPGNVHVGIAVGLLDRLQLGTACGA